jgi:hypothetical protein
MPASAIDLSLSEVEITSVSLRSCVLMAAVLSLVIGVVWGFMVLPTAVNENIPVTTAEGEMIRALGYHVLYVVPLLHVVPAIIFAALAALLYNLAAGRFGGVVVRAQPGAIPEGTWAIREIGVFPALKVGICLSLALMALQTLLHECVGWIGSLMWPLSWTPILYGSEPGVILFMVTVWTLVAVLGGILIGGVCVVLYDLVALIGGGVRVTARIAGNGDQEGDILHEKSVEMAAVVPRSAACTMGAVGLGVGFMTGVLTMLPDSGVLLLLGEGAGGIAGNTPAVVAGTLLIGIVLYGIAGGAMGYVIAVLYNHIARLVGGAIFVLKKMESDAPHPSE